MRPELLNQLNTDVELPVRNAGTSLGMFYGLGDWTRLPDASRIGAARRALDELRAAASALTELRQQLARDLVDAEDAVLAADETVCSAEWGVCPEHGSTLCSTGGKSWCTSLWCGRSWNTDRVGRHCTEPAAVIAADPNHELMRLCAGHWLDAQERIVGVRLVRWLPQRPKTNSVPSTVDGVA
ncbi:MAG TPA: hypothetical protein VLJ59_05195 [Mycobacteriales bacterium]|nr:hypothetical protein [Mycobacteriales bacterium]